MREGGAEALHPQKNGAHHTTLTLPAPASGSSQTTVRRIFCRMQAHGGLSAHCSAVKPRYRDREMRPWERLSGNAARLIVLAVACWIVPAAVRAQSGESVVYSVTTRNTQSGITTDKTQLSKTEIFAVDPETGKQRLVFSDADSPFSLMPGGGQRTGASGAADGRIFAEGVLVMQTPMRHTLYFDPGAAPAIYELSTDGSGQARKAHDIERSPQNTDFSNLFFNSSGTELGHISHPD
ncbi:MAG TPA: hypothetical protein VMT09_16515, partial [Steroidobacteraceae bacterium]|nr:hypothetical protein [Steroidobacteraceae bacterium]